MLIFSLIVTSNSYCNDIVEVVKDQEAPISGILFSPEKANEVRKELIIKDELEKTNSSLNRSLHLKDLNIKLMEDELDNLQTQNNRLIKASEVTKWEKAMWIGIGVLGTSLALYTANRIYK